MHLMDFPAGTRVLLKLEGFSDVSRKLKAKDGPNLLQQRIILKETHIKYEVVLLFKAIKARE